MDEEMARNEMEPLDERNLGIPHNHDIELQSDKPSGPKQEYMRNEIQNAEAQLGRQLTDHELTRIRQNADLRCSKQRKKILHAKVADRVPGYVSKLFAYFVVMPLGLLLGSISPPLGALVFLAFFAYQVFRFLDQVHTFVTVSS